MNRSTLSIAMTSMFLAQGMCLSADQPSKNSAAAKDSKASHDHSRIASKVHVESVTRLSDREANEVALCGSRIIKHVVQARDALRHDDQAGAVQHLGQATKLLAIIDSVLPQYKVTTEIKSGELAYKDEDEFTPQYITLFEELERRDILTPIAQAKLAADQKEAGGEESGEDIPLAVTHADVDLSAIRLDLTLTRRMLAVAQKFLDAKKVKQADTELMMLLARSVVFVYDEVDLPLEEAADNLKLAEWELKNGQRKDAKAALHTAMDQLKAYEREVGESRAKEVKALHQEIEKLTHELGEEEASEETNKEHAAKVESWWQRATKWFRKAPASH